MATGLAVGSVFNAAPLTAAILDLGEADLIVQTGDPVDVLFSVKLDFDGNGFGDIAYVTSEISDHGVRIFFGGPSPSVDYFKRENSLRLVSNDDISGLGAGDINGDGREDLLVGSTSGNNVRIVRGRARQVGTVPLSQSSDLTVLGKADSGFGSSIASGDFNGDRFDDILLGAPQIVQEAYVLWGSASFGGVIDLSTGVPGPIFRKVGPSSFSRYVHAGDVNGDGLADLLLSAPDAEVEGLQGAGEVYILWGRTDFPSPWDLNVTTPDVRIQGGSEHNRIRLYGTSDFDGDAKADLLVGPGLTSYAMYPGTLLSSGLSVVSVRLASPHYRPGVVVTPFAPLGSLGDFDGDGRTDIFSLPTFGYANLYLGWLTTDDPPEWGPGESLEPQFFIEHGYLSSDHHMTLSDLNGDGFVDLVVGPKNEETKYVFFGHQPLRSPAIGGPVSVSKALVPLTLSVSGQPTEMMVGGDILDSFKDQWIPYAARKAVTLTGANGNKTVTVRFRNKFRRESDSAAKGIELAAAGTQPEATTTRLRKGGRAMVQCSMGSGGRLKAAVWTSEGTKVVEVMDEEKGPGVWVVEWDGRNGEGRRVAPGVYILEIEIDGRADRKKILVQG